MRRVARFRLQEKFVIFWLVDGNGCSNRNNAAMLRGLKTMLVTGQKCARLVA